MKKVLFVCIENANRSQMAQAFAIIHGKDKVRAYSAGSKPSGKVNPKAIRAMNELGYDLTKHSSNSLDDIPKIKYDYVISMGCGDQCPTVSAHNRIDWDIPDPRDLDEAGFRGVRGLILQKVNTLLTNIN